MFWRHLLFMVRSKTYLSQSICTGMHTWQWWKPRFKPLICIEDFVSDHLALANDKYNLEQPRHTSIFIFYFNYKDYQERVYLAQDTAYMRSWTFSQLNECNSGLVTTRTNAMKYWANARTRTAAIAEIVDELAKIALEAHTAGQICWGQHAERTAR